MTIATQSTEEKDKAFYESYAYLRTMLDSIEANSLVYFAEARSSEERIARYESLYKIILPCIKEIKMLSNPESEGHCNPPLEECGPFCVPAGQCGL